MFWELGMRNQYRSYNQDQHSNSVFFMHVTLLTILFS